MSKLRELAYRLDPVLWVRGRCGDDPDLLAGDFSALASGRIDFGVDRPAGRQDHRGGMGDRAFDGVFSTIVVGDRLPGATAERRSGAAGARGALRPAKS